MTEFEFRLLPRLQDSDGSRKNEQLFNFMFENLKIAYLAARGGDLSGIDNKRCTVVYTGLAVCIVYHFTTI